MPSSFAARLALLLLTVAWLLTANRAIAEEAPPAPATADSPPAVDPSSFAAADVEFFEKQVRPLLVSRCQSCHGPDKQQGNLRLDGRKTALDGGDTGPAVVPGKPDESLLVDAIRYGETYQMPPKSQLPAAEIEILVEWVRRGAPWGHESAAAGKASGAPGFDLSERAKHWSFRPVTVVEPPAVKLAQWPRTPLDSYILARLEAAGLEPAEEADRATWLRRVTFDLTGLPPTADEIAAFLQDQQSGAYERVADRLLASPRFGERWARHWLDLVRYAETYGHEFDFDLPNAYRYRDYVIRAFNADVPYDQFVIEHVAGDLLPTPRRHPTEGFNESIIGTASFYFGEAKHSPVDVRQDEADRIDNQIDVFAKTFLGLTVSCARCHDHKFDAISTKDYYALAGYLQSSRLQQAFIDPPEQIAPWLAELQRVRDERLQAFRAFAREGYQPRVASLAQRLLAAETPATTGGQSTPAGPKVDVSSPWHTWSELARLPNDATPEAFSARRAELVSTGRAAIAQRASQAAVADFDRMDFTGWMSTGPAFGEQPAKALDWVFAGSSATLPGRLLEHGAAHSGALSAKLHGVLRSPTFEIVGPKLWYRLYGNGGRVRLILDGLHLIQNPIYGGLNFSPASEEPYWHAQDLSKWVGHRAYLELVDDGDGYVALEQAVFADQQPAPLPSAIVLTALDDASLTTRDAVAQRYQAAFARVWDDWLSGAAPPAGEEVDRAAIVRGVLQQEPSGEVLPAARARLDEQFAALQARATAAEGKLPAPRHVPAMADGTAENEHVFIRGSHKTLGEEVPRRFLEALGGARHPTTATGSGRLELARQLVSPDCPLTARVIVNRLWHHHFGAGLVRSPDDFGVMGQPPTHPELLDYLASELVREGWSLKSLHRQMVLSSTYRMRSRASEGAEQADPTNQWWHRANVRRLEAEAIRDAMLAVSGRLDDQMFGPSVPPHLTPYMVGRGRPAQSGPLDGNGRRSIYLAIRRNFLSPLALAFDYPTPFTTIGRRGVSNVPAQALTLLNNPLVQQQAEQWGAKVASQSNVPQAERVNAMYLAAFARQADAEERRAAVEFLQAAHSADGVSEAEAWSELAHVLFNVKEFIFIP